jgi:isocitrate dehydrogenase
VAERVHNAWLKTVEDAVATADIAGRLGVPAVGTAAFADAVIARLGQKPERLPAVRYGTNGQALAIVQPEPVAPADKQLVGIDVFVHWAGTEPDALAGRMRAAQNGAFELALVTNRGVKVWPQGLPETALTDHWRCRYMAKPGKELNKAMVAELQMRLALAGVDFVKTEHLGQGQ